MSNLKKALYVGASAALVLWSMGGLLTASATTISDGDLVKVAGVPAVYYIQGTTARVFPHANVYVSWGYTDYNSVKTITADDLAAYSTGNPMPFRDGSLFRGFSTGLGGYAANAVYYVLDGQILPVQSSAIYQALFTDPNWLKVTWVPDDLLDKFNYPVGTMISSSSTHPDGSLVQYTVGGTKYLISGGLKRAFASAAAFTANHYLAANVITISSSEAYGDGEAITVAEAGIMTPGWVGVANPTGGLMVSDGGSPAATTIPGGATNVNLIKVRLTAGNTAVTVNSLKFKRSDIGAYSEWTALYLYQGDTRITSSDRTLNTSNTVEFPSINIAIAANSSQTVTLRGDLGAIGTSSVGSRHLFSVTAITTTATVTGLPLAGNALIVGSQSVGTATISHGSASTDPTVGAKEAEVLVFKIANTSATDDLTFNQVVFYYAGTMSRSGLTNMKLYINGETSVIASAAAINSDDTVTLTLASPYTINHGVTKTFVLKGDVSGRSAEYFSLYMYATNHLVVIDTTYNTGAVVTLADTIDDVDDTKLTLQGGTVSVADNGPTTGTIGKSQTGVVLTKFAMTSERDVEVRHIQVLLTSSATTSTTDCLSNLRIIDQDTGDTLEQSNITLWPDNTVKTYTLNTTFNLTANTTRNLAVTVDIGNDVNAYLTDKTLSASISLATASYVYDVVDGQYLAAAKIVPNTVTGDNQTIAASALIQAVASVPVSATVTKGTSNVDSLGVTFTATDASAISIRQIKAHIYASSSGAGEYVTSTDPAVIITAVKLYDPDTATVLATKNVTGWTAAGTYGTVTFDGLDVTVPKGGSKKLTIRADLNSSATVAHWYYVDMTAADYTVAYDSNSNEVDATDALNTAAANVEISVSTAGTLTMSQDAGTPNTGIVVAGTNNVVLSKIKFAAATEAFTVDKFQVQMATSTYDSSIVSVTISPAGGTPQTKSLTSGVANFTNIGWVIPADTSKVVTITANLSTIVPANNTTGRDLMIGIDGADTSTFRAVGASQTVLTASTDASIKYGNSMFVRKSKPTVSLVALGSSILADGTMSLYKFNVAADSANDLALKKFKFDITVSDNTTSTVLLTANTWQLYDASDMGTALSVGWSDGTTTSTYATTGGAVPLTIGSQTLYGAIETEKVIPAGSSATFVLKGVITGSDVTDSIITRLGISDDTVNYMAGLSEADDTTLWNLADATTSYTTNFLWSDMSSGVSHIYTAGTTYKDWASGYLVQSLPTDYQSLTK